MSSTPRFILVDQSLRGYGGHYFNYASRVLDAAGRAGFEGKLICHRAFEGSMGDGGIDVIPEFRYSTFETAIAVPRGMRAIAKRVRGALGSVRAGAAGLWKRSGAAVRVGIALVGLVLSPVLLVLVVCAVVMRVLMMAANRMRHEPKIRAFDQDLSSGLKPVLGRGLAGGGANGREELGAGDVVFVPTISAPELVGLARFLRRSEQRGCATWHIVLRQDVPEGEDTRRKREALAGVRAVMNANARVKWWTDTEALTKAWSEATGIGFGTLPIPVGEGFRPKEERAESEPLRVVYVGDARMEKGFHLLPSVARALRDGGYFDGKESSGKKRPVKLVVQASARVVDPEPACLEAIAELTAMERDGARSGVEGRRGGVELVTDELDEAGYTELVRGADVMLVLYDADAYKRRSSGILAEAMASGVPALAPAGTWLEASVREFMPLGGGAEHSCIVDRGDEVNGKLLGMVEEWARVSRAAREASVRWRERHNADAVVRRIVE